LKQLARADGSKTGRKRETGYTPIAAVPYFPWAPFGKPRPRILDGIRERVDVCGQRGGGGGVDARYVVVGSILSRWPINNAQKTRSADSHPWCQPYQCSSRHDTDLAGPTPERLLQKLSGISLGGTKQGRT
jgi:hypothetical protein